MTNEEILEKQVEALEKLLQLKQAIIDELESKAEKSQYPGWQIGAPTLTVPYTPSWQCVDGYPHQYPTTWGGIIPPCCTKCGVPAHQSASGSIVTVTNGTAQMAPVHTSGYIQTQDLSASSPAHQPSAGSNNLFTLTAATKK